MEIFVTGGTGYLGGAIVRAQMGAFADAMCEDRPVISTRSAELGWKPAHPSFREAATAAYEEWRAS